MLLILNEYKEEIIMEDKMIRLGGPIFKKVNNPEEAVKIHQKLGFSAAYTSYIEDSAKREEYKQAFAEADIVLAEFGAYCINIMDTDPEVRQKNIDEITRRLEKADKMGARCCVMHGGSLETAGWGKANPENLSERTFIETVEIIQAIIDRVKPETTKLVMETESYVYPDSPENYLRFINAIDREEFAVHLDPINIISNPRRFYFNDQFLRRCFAVLGKHIVSCHAKDVNMSPIHPTVKIDETFIGDGVVDYKVYLKEILKLDQMPTMMIEHLNASQLKKGLNFIYNKADEIGVQFLHSKDRDIEAVLEDNDEYFAPHEE